MFEKGAYLFTFDLRGAYHHICIQEKSRAFLGFAWNDGQVTRYYVVNVLAFGIASAGHIFSKVVREVVKYWRSLGHKIVMFLDDGIGGDSYYRLASESSRFVRQSIVEFGFLLADDKCHWEPVREVVWLGHVLNMNDHRLYITEERIKRLENFIDSIMYQIRGNSSGISKVRALASAVGQVISLQSVLGKIVRLRTRALYSCILSKASWNAPVKVTLGAIDELKFWRENSSLLNQEKPINEKTVYNVKMYSDASSTGYGAYLEDNVVTLEWSESIQGSCKSSEMVHLSGLISPDVGYDVNAVSITEVVPPEVGHMVPPEIKDIRTAKDMLSGKASGNNKAGKTSGFGNSVIVGDWNCQEKSKSSTWREVEAIKRVLSSSEFKK